MVTEAAQEAVPLAGIVGVGAWVAIREGAAEGAIDEDGDLARGGSDGLGLPHPDGETAVKGAERGLAPDDAAGGHSEHGGRAIGGGLGAGAEPAAAGDLVLGGAGEPRGEMLLSGPPADVGADLGEQLERVIGGDAIDLGQVGAGQLVERRANVEGRLIPVATGDPRARQRGGGAPRPWRSGSPAGPRW